MLVLILLTIYIYDGIIAELRIGLSDIKIDVHTLDNIAKTFS